jgi:hypothetical protein
MASLFIEMMSWSWLWESIYVRTLSGRFDRFQETTNRTWEGLETSIGILYCLSPAKLAVIALMQVALACPCDNHHAWFVSFLPMVQQITLMCLSIFYSADVFKTSNRKMALFPLSKLQCSAHSNDGLVSDDGSLLSSIIQISSVYLWTKRSKKRPFPIILLPDIVLFE